MPAKEATRRLKPLDWPPPPHDPRERALVATVGGWEVRVFPPCDQKYQYFVSRGFLHAQLWHRESGVSVLTPSRLTGGLFELYPYAGWKAPVRSAPLLRSLVAQAHGVMLPSVRRLTAVIEWYVRAEERRAARAGASARPSSPTARGRAGHTQTN